MKFHYLGEMPPEVRPAIEKQLEPLAVLLPGWVQKVNVFWCADPDNEDYQAGAAIWANASYDYRVLSLTFTPLWLESNTEARRDMTIHDVLHAITSVLADYARAEIQRLLPADEAPKYKSAILDELTTRHESMTQDLAFVVGKLLDKSNS